MAPLRLASSVDIGEKTFSVCRARIHKNSIEILDLQKSNLRRLSKRKINGQFQHVKKQTPEQALEQLKDWYDTNEHWFLDAHSIYVEDQIAAAARMKALFASLWTLVSEHKDEDVILKKSSARDRYEWLLERFPGNTITKMNNFDPRKKWHRIKYNVKLVEKLIVDQKITGAFQDFFFETKRDDLAVAILQIFYEEKIEG